MERRQIGLKLVLDQLGLPARVETFEDRLILQKAVYLAQAAGVHLGYYFRWYVRGPYSPSISDDGYAISTELSQSAEDFTGWTLDEASSAKLAKMHGVAANPDRSALAKKLELLASVHYLIDRNQVPDQSVGTVTDKLHACDKQFTEQEVSVAIGELKTYGLLS
jgi:uncharacterized protein YwgA